MMHIYRTNFWFEFILGFGTSLCIHISDRNWFHPIRVRLMEIETETMTSFE